MSEKWRCSPMKFMLACIDWIVVIGLAFLCGLALIGIFVLVALGLSVVLHK